MQIDGITYCDRCRNPLPGGMGVISGLLCTVILPGQTGPTDFLFCYEHGCRDAALAGRLSYHPTPGVCDDCGVPVPDRALSLAMLAADVFDGDLRTTTFCYANGSSAAVLAHLNDFPKG